MDNDREVITSFLNSASPTISFEFFPPKDESGLESLRASFVELSKISPDFISVTYGAMGANQEKSLAVVKEFARQVPTIAHLTCIGSTKDSLTSLLAQYEYAGVAAILALRGDVPTGFDGELRGDFVHATDLVELIRSTSFEIGVAAFPEKHPESPSLEHDLNVLKIKQAAGATFAMTQLFFDIEAYFDLVNAAKSQGVTMPVVPGLMPIANARQVLRMAEMSGARIPELLLQELKLAKDEDQAREIGMRFSIQLAKELIERGAPGLHIFTLNHHRATLELLQGAGLA